MLVSGVKLQLLQLLVVKDGQLEILGSQQGNIQSRIHMSAKRA